MSNEPGLNDPSEHPNFPTAEPQPHTHELSEPRELGDHRHDIAFGADEPDGEADAPITMADVALDELDEATAGQDDEEDEAPEDERYTPGMWGDFPQFNCKLCPFDSLDFERFEEHWQKDHVEVEPEETRATRPTPTLFGPNGEPIARDPLRR